MDHPLAILLPCPPLAHPPSVSARMESKLRTPAWDSILEMMWMWEPPASASALVATEAGGAGEAAR
jgi:hypothetical protein